MIKRAKSLICWILSLVLVSGVVTGSNATILCIGADDHVEVESVCQPRCSGGENSVPATTEGLSGADHDECFECTDVEISQEVLQYRQSSLIGGLQTLSLSLPAFTAVSSPCDFPRIPNRSFSAGLSGPISVSSGEHLATTVIRC